MAAIAATSDLRRMMIPLSVFYIDEIIFELADRELFDVNQMKCGSEFFIGLKATLFMRSFDLDQMGMCLP
jgi:hypothetical protein